ncbi:MAG TPA: arginine--tRNA ligase [Polyangiaceae bacterium]|jgi:arginyl-tRNA synthetase|nr:arginine--tRNA ligase [Polyangiaceae bacterium]
MTHPVSRLRELVSAAVVESFGPEHAAVDPAVHRSAFADYQADVALRLARAVRKPPLEVAKALAAAIDASELCEDVQVSPPGFVNFRLRRDVLETSINALVRDERAGVPRVARAQTIVIDYSSPNVAKEMHVGNLRTTVIGDCLARLLGFQGHRVVRQNHIGDWGTPFGMLVEHLHDLGSEQSAAPALADLKAFYQAARSKFDADPSFADRARQRVVLLQAGDPATLAIWRTLIQASLVYLRSVYQKLGVLLTDDDVRGESFYNPLLPRVADELEQRGVAQIDQGALCVMMPEFKNREGETLPLIVRKKDGGFGYAATDLAALRFRVDELHADRLLYVVGSPQQQHFSMVFAAARKAGWLPESVHAEHVGFGSVLGADRKLLRTRSGDSPSLVELLDEATERADAAVREKNAEMPAEMRARVAQQVGIGAIKYADLSSERIKDYVFDWSRMLSFEGNTGPYLQYAHARICSILRRAAEGGSELAADLLAFNVPELRAVRLEQPAERALAIELIELSSAVEAAASTLSPHRLCTYLYELASRFTAFFESCPVLKADTPEQRDSRLVVCGASRRALAVGLTLLGMGAPDRM